MNSNLLDVTLSIGEEIVSVFIDRYSIFLDLHLFQVDIMSNIFVSDRIEAFLISLVLNDDSQKVLFDIFFHLFEKFGWEGEFIDHNVFVGLFRCLFYFLSHLGIDFSALDFAFFELAFGSVFFFAFEEPQFNFFFGLMSHNDLDAGLFELRTVDLDKLNIILIGLFGRKFNVPIDLRHQMLNLVAHGVVFK